MLAMILASMLDMILASMLDMILASMLDMTSSSRTTPVCRNSYFYKEFTYNPQLEPVQSYNIHKIRQYGEEFGS
jgi:hypothetical protein